MSLNSHRSFIRVLFAACCLLSLAPLSAATLSHPDVDAFNIRIGTQTFGPRYQFTTHSALIETADAIRAMGSDVVKFYLGKGLARQYPGLTVPPTVTNLATLARDEPSCRHVLDMPFRHFLVWAYCFSASGDAPFLNGFSETERQKEYNEILDLTRHLLTCYSGSGKNFYLGHWEGDWYLLPNYNTATNPSPIAIQGMIDWLNTRQQAVDDAMRTVPHTNVAVFHYTEVNRVRDAMLNAPTNNQRLVNRVLPAITNLDFVSWSSYDGMDLASADLTTTLNYIESQLPTRKAAAIPGRRVLIGEYGWGGTQTSEAQEALTRAYLRKLLPWSPRFILFWEMYDNENKAYWLIDRTGARTPCYLLHARLANLSRLEVARFRESQGRLPRDSEFSKLLTPHLAQILPEPAALTLSDQKILSLTGGVATVTATLTQGLYGDEGAEVHVLWGPADGGTLATNWAHRTALGVNTRFNPTPFTAALTNPVPGADLIFRFHATNRNGQAWSTNSMTYRTPVSSSSSSSSSNPE